MFCLYVALFVLSKNRNEIFMQTDTHKHTQITHSVRGKEAVVAVAFGSCCLNYYCCCCNFSQLCITIAFVVVTYCIAAFAVVVVNGIVIVVVVVVVY